MYQALITVRHGVKLPRLLLEHVQFWTGKKIFKRHAHHSLVLATPDNAILEYKTLFTRFCPEAHIGHQDYEPRTCKDLKSGSRNDLHVWTRGFVVHFVAPVDCFRRFHLYDRVGNPLLTHNDRLKIPKIPAMLELCIQEGFDLKEIGLLDKAKGLPYIHGCRADHRIWAIEPSWC